MEVKVRGLQAVIRRLDGVDPKLRDKLRAAVEITARHIKDDAKQNLKGITTRNISHIPNLPNNIQYVMSGNRYYVAASVHVSGKQGRQVGVIEYGSPTSAPHPFLMPAALMNRADFLKGVELAVKDSIK